MSIRPLPVVVLIKLWSFNNYFLGKLNAKAKSLRRHQPPTKRSSQTSALLDVLFLEGEKLCL